MVLFTSNHELNRAENIKAVYDAYDGEKFFIKVNPWKNNPEFSSSKYSLRVTDEFISASPRKALMIGHGISGGKTYGLDQPHPYHNIRNARLLTYVIATSSDMVELTAKQCGVDTSRVLPLGMPRTDAYFGKKKGDGGTILAEKRAYLYAPTFRGQHESPMPSLDWEYIDKSLTDDEVLVVKPHMVTKHILDGAYRHIVEVSSEEPSTPYLIDCDVLITDYSSIMLDAHILEKPVVLFEKSKGYTETRGMYLPYPHGYASRYCTNERDLVDVIREADIPQEEDIRCRQITASACDGHSTERVVKLIKELI